MCLLILSGIAPELETGNITNDSKNNKTLSLLYKIVNLSIIVHKIDCQCI